MKLLRPQKRPQRRNNIRQMPAHELPIRAQRLLAITQPTPNASQPPSLSPDVLDPRYIQHQVRRRKAMQRAKGIQRKVVQPLNPDKIYLSRTLSELKYMDTILDCLTKPYAIQSDAEQHWLDDMITVIDALHLRMTRAREACEKLSSIPKVVDIAYDEGEFEDSNILIDRIGARLEQIAIRIEARTQKKGKLSEMDDSVIEVCEMFGEVRAVLLGHDAED